MNTNRLQIEGIQRDEEPLVHFKWGENEGYITPEDAKGFALLLIEVATAADMDREFLDCSGQDKIYWETKRESIELER